MRDSRKTRWGILSTADIGMKKVIPAIMKSPLCEVVAISSRSQENARAAADQLGIEKAYGSYEALLDDPDIDIVYNPLPNHLHVPLTLEAANAGKHVLCEKPIALNANEAASLRNVPATIKIMEAFMVRFHPQWMRAREIAASGELGEMRAVRSVFSYFNRDPNNVRNKADIGGGGLMDIGCYPITAGRYFFQREPQRVVSLMDRDPDFGTDRQTSAIVDFGNGCHLTFLVSTQLIGRQSVELLGTKGSVEILIPFNAPQDQATAIEINKGRSLDNALARREILAPCDQYTEQATTFAQAVLGEVELPYGVEDAITSMAIIDAVFKSEQTGGWVDVKRL